MKLDVYKRQARRRGRRRRGIRLSKSGGRRRSQMCIRDRLYTLLRGAVDSRLERRQGPRSGDL